METHFYSLTSRFVIVTMFIDTITLFLNTARNKIMIFHPRDIYIALHTRSTDASSFPSGFKYSWGVYGKDVVVVVVVVVNDHQSVRFVQITRWWCSNLGH